MDEFVVMRRFNSKSIFDSDEKLSQHLISKKIKEILLKVDLNEITSKSVRSFLTKRFEFDERHLGFRSIRKFFSNVFNFS